MDSLFVSVSTLLHSSYITHLVGLSLHLRPSEMVQPNLQHAPVPETTCRLSALQKPHKSLMTRI